MTPASTTVQALPIEVAGGHRGRLPAAAGLARGFGTLLVVDIEGTGVYGAGLARHLAAEGVAMLEVDRPDRKTRRFAGKSDPLDAEAAARSALAGVRTGTRKTAAGR